MCTSLASSSDEAPSRTRRGTLLGVGPSLDGRRGCVRSSQSRVEEGTLELPPGRHLSQLARSPPRRRRRRFPHIAPVGCDPHALHRLRGSPLAPVHAPAALASLDSAHPHSLILWYHASQARRVSCACRGVRLRDDETTSAQTGPLCSLSAPSRRRGLRRTRRVEGLAGAAIADGRRKGLDSGMRRRQAPQFVSLSRRSCPLVLPISCSLSSCAS